MARNVVFRIAVAAAAFAAVLFPAGVSTKTPVPVHTCATNAPPQPPLDLPSTTVDVGPRPWGVTYLNESIAFAAVNFSIAVLDTSEFTPKLVSLFSQQPDVDMGNDDISLQGYGYRSIALTHDQRNLYVATGYGAVIYDVPTLLSGPDNNPIVGTLSHEDGYVGRGAIELSITPNDQYIFISQEFGSNNTHNLGGIEVYNVTRLDDGTVINSWRGYILTGYRTIGQEFSQDYTQLFVTSEMSKTSTSQNDTTGSISVLDVETMKFTPGKSLIKEIDSGCHPTRSVMSVSREFLWVGLRDANQVLAYNATILGDNATDEDPLVATVNSGTSPIGMAAINNHIFTADSNRFNYSDASTGVTVIDAQSALLDGTENFPQIPAGAFSRELAVSPDGNTLLVAEFGAGTVRAVNVTSLNVVPS
jgi:DNA-binding beta-propeller fold protein YncE